MKHLKKFEETGYEVYGDQVETGEDALDGWKRMRDQEVDVYLGQLGDVVDLLQQAKDILQEIDQKEYNKESIDGIQKIIDDLTI
jgi:hypothetical protein